MEVLTVFTKEEREREAHEQRLMFALDQRSLLLDAEERGIEKGEMAGQVRLLQEMLNLPQTPTKDLAAMPPQDLAALLSQLRKQLRPNGS